MIEFPKIGEGDETELRAGMVFSMHPHAISTGRPARASTCRTPGSSPRTAACRSPACRCGSTTERRQPCMRRSSPKPVLPGEGGSDYERYLRTDELLALQKTRRRVDPPRRAALPDGAPDVGDLAEARVERGRGGDPAGRRPTISPRAIRLLRRANDCLKIVTGGARHARAHLAVGVPEVRKVLGHGSGFDSPGFQELRRVAQAARRGVPRARASAPG